MVRDGGNGFDAEQRRALKRLADRQTEIDAVLEARAFRRRVYDTGHTAILTVIGALVGLASAVVAFKEFFKWVGK